MNMYTLMTISNRVPKLRYIIGLDSLYCGINLDRTTVEGDCQFWHKKPPAGGFLGWFWAV